MRKLFALLRAIFFSLKRPLQSYDITMLWCSNWVVRASDSDLRKRDCSRGTIALSSVGTVQPSPKRSPEEDYVSWNGSDINYRLAGGVTSSLEREA